MMFDSRSRGVLDFLATTVAVIAVWVGTPVGGLVERGFRTALGMAPAEKPLIAYFEIRHDGARAVVVDAASIEVPVAARAEEDDSLIRIAGRTRLPPALSRAFAVVASGGLVTLDDTRTPWYDVRPLDHHAADRASLGLPPPARPQGTVLEAGLRNRLADALDLLAAYEAHLGGEDAALAAWAIGMPLIERAVQRARLLGESEPAGVVAFGDHLIRKDLDRVRGFVDAVQALRLSYEMQWPLAGRYPVTSPFGMRPHPIRGNLRLHAGIDLGAPEGTPIHAVADGVVRHAGKDGANGLNVQLDHGYGLRTAYCHASVLLVRTGERVKAGQVIARVGATGLATGPHLHYGVYVANKPVDPMVFRPPELDLPFDLKEPARPPPRRNLGRN
jgi:murein DD-endopeptidase MepM/ murein hydrolase activator NlpD